MIIANTLKRFGGAFGSPDDEMNLVSPAASASAESYSALLHEAVVLPQQEVLIDLGHRIERDANDDQQRRATETERDVDHVGNEDRQQRDEGEKQRSRKRDARHHVVDVLGG